MTYRIVYKKRNASPQIIRADKMELHRMGVLGDQFYFFLRQGLIVLSVNKDDIKAVTSV